MKFANNFKNSEARLDTKQQQFQFSVNDNTLIDVKEDEEYNESQQDIL